MSRIRKIGRASPFALVAVLGACAASSSTPVRFLGRTAPPPLPHVVESGAPAAEVHRAIVAVLPGRHDYALDSLSCVHTSLSGAPSTSCDLVESGNHVRVDEAPVARALLDAVLAAGARHDSTSKVEAVRLRNLRVTRDAVAFDDAANARVAPEPNVRLTSKEARAVMNAIADAGVKEDDGSLFVVCTRFGAEPECTYRLYGRPSPKLDRAQAAALWNAFVRTPGITVLNASHFVHDGETLAFVGVFDTARPPSPPR